MSLKSPETEIQRNSLPVFETLDYFTHEREGELDWYNNWDSCYDQGYTTDLIADEAVECINSYSRQSPYFLYVSFNAPHSPYMVPNDELYSMIPQEEFEILAPKDKKGGIPNMEPYSTNKPLRGSPELYDCDFSLSLVIIGHNR